LAKQNCNFTSHSKFNFQAKLGRNWLFPRGLGEIFAKRNVQHDVRALFGEILTEIGIGKHQKTFSYLLGFLGACGFI
jgi:hypothetical protein